MQSQQSASFAAKLEKLKTKALKKGKSKDDEFKWVMRSVEVPSEDEQLLHLQLTLIVVMFIIVYVYQYLSLRRLCNMYGVLCFLDLWSFGQYATMVTRINIFCLWNLGKFVFCGSLVSLWLNDDKPYSLVQSLHSLRCYV